MIYNVHKKGDKYMIEEADIGIDSAAFHERFKLLEEQETMETKELYLYKVNHRSCSNPYYVAAESQAEAIEKVKDTDTFKVVNPCELSVTYMDMVTT